MYDFTLLYDERETLAKEAAEYQLSANAAAIFEHAVHYLTEDMQKIFLGPGDISELETPDAILLAHVDTWMAAFDKNQAVFDGYNAGQIGQDQVTAFISLHELCESVLKRVITQKTSLTITTMADCLNINLANLPDEELTALGDKVSGAMLEQLFALYEHNHDLLPLDLTELAFIPAATLYVNNVVTHIDPRFQALLDELIPRIQDEDSDGKILEIMTLALGRIAKREKELGHSLRIKDYS